MSRLSTSSPIPPDLQSCHRGSPEPYEDAKDSHMIKLYEKLAALLEMSGSRNNERGRSKGRASVSNCLRKLDLEAVSQQLVR